MQKSILSAAIVAGALAMSSGANASECGEISMADMNWPSATLMANVDKIILEATFPTFRPPPMQNTKTRKQEQI